MQIDLSGRKALVTGGMNGIGRAIVEALVACGAEVTAADIEGGEAPAGARWVRVDVTEPESIEAALEDAGRPEIVVANAGIVSMAALDQTTRQDWDRTLAVNLSGAFHTVQRAARHMKERRGGAIVMTASTNSYDGEPELAAYNATKAGLLGILHTAAGELGPWGIRVNAVCPGLIRTRLTAGHFAQGELLKEYFRHIPLGRGGHAGEVGRAVAFLASDLASYITGAALLVDGGQMASKFGAWNESFARFDTDHWELK
ncbi:MAG: SDR family oxidoreductase [Acidobacteria bacterium]|nr:SDR family oxidoreductase [Acidobacteriota bacterium]